MNYLIKYSPKSLLFVFTLYVLRFKKTSKLLLLFLLYFHRQNCIKKNINNNEIVSPASGEILGVKLHNNIYTISIYLNVFDHHIQYVPINGYVKSVQHKSGIFKPAFLLEKTEFNEKMTTIISTVIGDVKIEQIAGQFAKSIYNFNQKNDYIKKQNKLGIITFGSRVNIYLPANKIKILVKKGDTLSAGNTIISKINKYY